MVVLEILSSLRNFAHNIFFRSTCHASAGWHPGYIFPLKKGGTRSAREFFWMPACAGMTVFLCLMTTIANAGQLKNLDTQPLTGTVIDKPKPIKDFSLTGTDGKPFTSKNLKNHWTFLFFGFTRCGYVCPTSMTALKQVYAELQKNTNVPKPQIVFVSIDPERDDLTRIRKYVTSFNQDFSGATGNKSALNQLTSQLGILYMKITRADQKAKSSNNYDIDHTGSILLVDPDGELIAIFSMPHQADRITKDYNAITSHYV